MEYCQTACEIWPKLTDIASRSDLITYMKLGAAVGVYHEGPDMSQPLALIRDYCINKKLPPLAALVVYAHTREPASECGVSLEEWPQKVREIFEYDWTHTEAPTPEILEKLAAEIARRNAETQR